MFFFSRRFEEETLERHFTEPSRQSHVSPGLYPEAGPRDPLVQPMTVGHCSPARRLMASEYNKTEEITFIIGVLCYRRGHKELCEVPKVIHRHGGEDGRGTDWCSDRGAVFPPL